MNDIYCVPFYFDGSTDYQNCGLLLLTGYISLYVLFNVTELNNMKTWLGDLKVRRERESRLASSYIFSGCATSATFIGKKGYQWKNINNYI